MRRTLVYLLTLLAPAVVAAQVPVTLSGVTPAGDTVRLRLALNVTLDSATVSRLFVKPDTVLVPGPVVSVTDTLYCDSVLVCSRVKPAPLPPPSVPIIAGRAFGLFHHIDNTYFSAAMRGVYLATIRQELPAARKAGIRLIVGFIGGRANYRDDRTGGFDLAKWKARIKAMHDAEGPYIRAYADSGTIIGHYLIDEPDCGSCFNGDPPTLAELQEMGRYAKELFPYLPTIFRVVPSKLETMSKTWPYLDAAWSQYEGRFHVPSGGRSPSQFRDEQVAAAKRIGVGLVLGFNVLDGGDGPASPYGDGSKIPGTYFTDPNPGDNVARSSNGSYYRYQMSAAEVERAASAFLASDYACAVIGWISDQSAHASLVEQMWKQPGMLTAYGKVFELAKAQPVQSCGKSQ